MQEERFWLLASLRLSGEASPEELTEISGYLAQHPEMALRLEIFANVWHQQHLGNAAKREDAFNKHLQRLSTHLSAPVLQYEYGSDEIILPRRRRSWWIAATAAAASIAIAFLFLYRYAGNPGKTGSAQSYNTVSTRPGSKSKIQLPDGTQVWLNADSRLTYKLTDPAKPREVQLTGEAYFDVAKDKDHPFLIHTAAIDIKVLGTSFNVRAYANEKNTVTALVQGSVEITPHHNPDKKIILKPSEKLAVRNDTDPDSVAAADPAAAGLTTSGQAPATRNPRPDEPLMTLGRVHFQQKDSSVVESLWTKNQLAFDRAPLDEIALQIEHWYAVRVIISGERLKKMQLSATFGDESLQQVLEALSVSGNFTYKIHQKVVAITP
jgi:transmembrane sensor